jgi:hypothetical protein
VAELKSIFEQIDPDEEAFAVDEAGAELNAGKVCHTRKSENGYSNSPPATVRVISSPAALRDIRHVYNYIDRLNRGAAEGLARDLVAAVNSLGTFP